MSYKTIDLIVLGDTNWPGTSIYLEYLYRHGFKPKKIYMCSFYQPVSYRNRLEKVLYTLSPKLYKYASPPVIESYSSLIQSLCHSFQEPFSFKIDIASVDRKVDKYSNIVKYYKFWDFKDPDLFKLMLQDKDSFFLYVSGGIVPKEIFEAGLKIIHTHPGLIPYTRGSDGFLWSLLTRGKLGYSCFFMNQYIDGGDLLYQEEKTLHDFSDQRYLIKDNYLDIYRALLLSYDPHMRAQILTKTITQCGGILENLQVIEKDKNSGRDYFRMHKNIIKKTLLEYL